MKSLKGLLIAVVACGAVALFCGISSAEMESGAGKAHHQAQIKLLQDSSAALKTSNPELAKKLSAWATDEMNEKEEGKGHEEKEEKAEKKNDAEHQARLKLLRDSSVALRASHPDLAVDLTKKADKMEKRMKADAREDVKEGAEAK